jgi:hypothetical protein
MTVRLNNITVDGADRHRPAQFWPQLTGSSEDPGGGAPDHREVMLFPPAGWCR